MAMAPRNGVPVSDIVVFRPPRRNPTYATKREALEQFCLGRGLLVDEWIAEVGGRLNFQRKQFLRVVDRIIAGEIGVLVIAHKDRLARFGFDLLVHLCDVHQCELLILNTESLSPEQEMVQDLMTIARFLTSVIWVTDLSQSLKAGA